MRLSSTKQIKKSEFERRIFSDFVAKLGWSRGEVNIESRPEPEPDILFMPNEGSMAFELVEICDSTLAHQIALIRGTGGVTTTWTSDPTPQLISNKLKKKYSSKYPIELLCYWNGTVISTDDQIANEIHRALDANSSHPFRMVWYFGEKAVYKWSVGTQVCSRYDFEAERDPVWQDCFF